MCMDKYHEYIKHGDNHDALDRWFESEQWREVMEGAQRGCIDSMELMEEVNEYLTSLVFHLRNGSSEHRIAYELRYFETLCDDFEVA